MKHIKENKELLLKYLYIIITNLLIYIFTSYYLAKIEYKDIIMLLLVVVMNMIIYNYKEPKKFKVYLDFIVNLIIGLILLLFIKDMLIYGTILFSLFFANNIVFIKSRLNAKFIIKTIQYIMILVYSIISLFINLLIFILI